MENAGQIKGGNARAAKLTPEERKEIAKKGAATRWGEGRSSNANNNKELVAIMPKKSLTPAQGILNLDIHKQVEIDGVGMGVLSDGTPFLTGRGLARICGISDKHIRSIADEWIMNEKTPRMMKISEIMQSHGFEIDKPYIAIEQRSGVFYAYPDVVCLAILEYYAFDAGTNIKEHAKKNYRLLAGKSLRDFIYAQVGYDPKNELPEVWKIFHDRLSLTYNAVPKGYFGIFKEMADMIITLGQSGLHIDSQFVPDISVGRTWSSHWVDNRLSEQHGERIKYEHNYPDYFSQSESNPQEPWCYPEKALGEFRRWLRDDYIGKGKFAKYLDGKIQQRQLPASFAQLAISAYGLKSG